MTRRASHHRAALIALATTACILAASCSTGDDSAATTSTIPPTTAPPTTVPPATTAQTTTTEQPPDTIDPVTAAEQAASQAVLDRALAWRDCIDDVPSCDPGPVLAPTTTGRAFTVLVDAIERWQTDGWEARPPLNPAHVGEEIVEVELVADNEARVVYCQLDGGQLVDPGAGPDGSDVIVNDEIKSLLAEAVVLRGDDDAWRVEHTEVIKSIEGGDGCDANLS